MKEQKVVFSIKRQDDAKQTVSIEFDPPLEGAENFDKLSTEEKELQNTAAVVANRVMDALAP